MKYLFLPIHLVIGSLIRLVDFITRPTPIKRSESTQQIINEKCKNLTLFYYPACPFCIRVKRNIRRLNLNIHQIDPRREPEWMKKLEQEGGKVQVPCLQITESNGISRWMYESSDINDYLDDEFAPVLEPPPSV